MKLTKLLAVVAITCAMLLSAPAAHAWRQPGDLNLGLTNVLDGAAPPPGLYLSLYNVLQTAQSADVRETGTFALPPNAKNLDVSLAAVVPQMVYVSPVKVLGGNLGIQGFPVLGSLSVDESTTGLPAGSFPVNNSLVGDLNFGPFIAFHHMLGGPWQLHWVAEFDSFAPVGRYDNTKAIQLATNHWTIDPFVAITLLGPCGTELSTRLHYTYNFTNDDFTPAHRDMQPGEAFHANYALTKEVFTPKLKIGVVGYYLQQLTEDRINGRDIPNSKERVLAVGPVIWYNPGPFIIEAKTHFDTIVENRPKATTGVVRIILKLM